jgi:hypothetical protein
MQRIYKLTDLIKYACSRYKINGIIEFEDLQQDCYLVLLECINRDSTCPIEKLKAHLWYSLNKKHRYLKAQRRVFNKSVSIDTGLDNTADIYDAICVHSDDVAFPHQNMINRDTEKFFWHLIDKLGDDDPAIAILGTVAFGGKIPDSLAMSYERLPTHLSVSILSEMIGFNNSVTRRALDRLRYEFSKLAPEYGIEIKKEKYNADKRRNLTSSNIR